MVVTTDERCTLTRVERVDPVELVEPVEFVELADLGDASVETKQVWFGQLPDNQFGLGFFRS